MNRRILVLKMLVLALDECVRKGEILTASRLTDLALQYGKGIDLEGRELPPFFERPIIEALQADPFA